MKRLNKADLDYIKWRIWEPLRRNLSYRNEFDNLKKDPLDHTALDSFYEKWRLPYAVDPSLSFDQLLTIAKGDTRQQAVKRIQNLFADLYHPEADSAAFVNLADCLHGKYLRVYIDLEKSRNQIEAEIKKVLDEWLSRDRLDFYGIRKAESSRLHWETWESRFKVYDLAENCTPFPKIALMLKVPVDTVCKQYRAACEAVNPGEEYKTRRKREKEADSAVLKPLFPCHSCTTTPKECDKTKKPCKRVEAFLKKYAEYPQSHLV